MDFYSNLTATSSSNASSIYPTIFEILSSDEIDDLLSPSVRYIVANLVARNPNKWTIKINNWFDEWFMLAAKLAIESHYLKNWDATFIENFYGLKRIDGTNPVLLNALRKNPPVEIPLRLRDAQRRVVLFEKVVAPYLTGKLELAYSKLLANTLVQRPPSENESWTTRVLRTLQALFVKYYPLIKKLIFILNLGTKLYFLSGRTGSTTVLDFVFKIQYARLSKYDYERNANKNSIPSPKGISRPPKLNRSALLSLYQRFLSGGGEVLKSSASQLFPAFIFMLRVFQWWTSQDISGEIQRKLNSIDKDIPPPPLPHEKNEDGTCRICKGPIQNPAAIGTGYVFCYPCILEYLPQHEGRCPVTGAKLLGCEFDQSNGGWSITGIRKLLL